MWLKFFILTVRLCGLARVTSQLLGNHGVAIPTGQSLANYLLLLLVYVPLLWRRGELMTTLRADWCVGFGDACVFVLLKQVGSAGGGMRS